MVDGGRDTGSFTVHAVSADGEERLEARAVLDASGTWTGPNPLGSDGLSAAGEGHAAGPDHLPGSRLLRRGRRGPLSRQARRRCRDWRVRQDGSDRARSPG